MSRYMMATTALHKLGDISRDEPDLCVVHEEDEAAYVGAWVTGLGFFNVRFPKQTTRDLTDAERAHFGNVHVLLNGHDIGPALVE